MKFKIGDHIYKPKGYKFSGTVVSVFQTTSGDTRIVAEMAGNGMLHIFNEIQLEIANPTSLNTEDIHRILDSMSEKEIAEIFQEWLTYNG